jgi:uncharacterized protein DUF6328
MQLERQLKIALDDSGLLILGAQVLFGFQFSGAFQDQSKELPAFSRAFVGAGLTLIMTAVALLIAPSMQHRIVERGQVATARYVVAAPFRCGLEALWLLMLRPNVRCNRTQPRSSWPSPQLWFCSERGMHIRCRGG